MKFYHALFGCQIKLIQEQGFEFALLPHEEDNVSGCLVQSGNPSKEGPLIYLNMNRRIETAIKTVEENGGVIVYNIQIVRQYGKRAVIIDSEGNKIALYDK